MRWRTACQYCGRCGSRTLYATTTIYWNSRDKQKKMAFDSRCAPVHMVWLDLELRGRIFTINLNTRIVLERYQTNNFNFIVVSVDSNSFTALNIAQITFSSANNFTPNSFLRQSPSLSCLQNRYIHLCQYSWKFWSSHFCISHRHKAKYTQWR